MKIARGSKSWILMPFFIMVVFCLLSVIFFQSIYGSIFLLLSVFLLMLGFFFLVFFRDPDRKIGEDIVAVADGKIQEIIDFEDNDIGKCTRISTFMNIYNVHVNRMPINGEIKEIKHVPGGYIPAFKKESERNERSILIINSKIGCVKVVQIAGTLARRIVLYVEKGDKLKKGYRFGIIRLGSRVDIYLPTNRIKKINVKVGDKVKAGESTIAKVND